jgi:CRP-like cAMP-binding protein
MTGSVNDKINTFFQQFPVQNFGKNELILRAGSAAQFFFFIETGAVKMTTTSKDGQNLVLTIFYPGSCFSLLTLINQNTNTYDCVALIETATRKVPQSEVIAFLQENPDVIYEFQLRLLKGLQGLLHRIEQTAFVSAYHRVAGLLLYFARHFSEHIDSSNQKRIEIRITHQEIAEWLGLSRENVSIQMKQLERDGLVRKNEMLVEITDLKKLEQL